jgi:hypothetical protein
MKAVPVMNPIVAVSGDALNWPSKLEIYDE